MLRTAGAASTEWTEDIHALFVDRTHISLWLGVVFFSLFSLLDWLYCRPFFSLFGFYRLSYVAILICLLLLLKYPIGQRQARAIMFTAMLLGTLTISLMTRELGGFASGYYVGILLMIAGAFSVLPLSVIEAMALGTAMYLVYFLTVFLASPSLDARGFTALINNSVFFFAIVIVTAIQCFDEIKTILSSLRTGKNLRTLHGELQLYTTDLEMLVQNRMEMLAESDLKFRDLYNTLPDLVVLIDAEGTIRMVNQHGAALLGQTPEDLLNTSLYDRIAPHHHTFFKDEALNPLSRDEVVQGKQFQVLTRQGHPIEVELSGNRVELPDQTEHYQLIFRDITQIKEIERQVFASDQLLDTSRRATIFGLARLAECRDDTTGVHLLRIREYTRILATELAHNPELRQIVTKQFIEDLCLSSVLHDIGKVGIPDDILLKPGKLTAAEFETMKLHCLYGSMALTSAEHDTDELGFLHMGEEVALFHHERWDGLGYPRGLRGNNIPLSARIVSLADVYDALTSSRTYKPAYHHEQARLLIVQESGHRFDPMVVNAFLRKEQDFKAARRDLLIQATPLQA